MLRTFIPPTDNVSSSKESERTLLKFLYACHVNYKLTYIAMVRIFAIHTGGRSSIGRLASIELVSRAQKRA